MDSSTSPKFSLNKTDLFKAGRGLLVVLAGAALTYLVDVIPQIDFGVYTPVVVSLSATAIELGRRYLTSYQG
jgi:hypothetical protein